MNIKFIPFVCLLLAGCQKSQPPVVSNDLHLLEATFETTGKAFGELTKEMKLKDPRTVSGSEEFSYTKDGEKYSIEYLYLPARKQATNLIILNSGIHGVEAPAGIFLQHQFLNECLAQQEIPAFQDQTGVLLIHGMNPYGAIHGRRANGNNVDLNRNSFELSKDKEAAFPGLKIENPDYKDLQDSFENRISQWDMIKLIVTKGKEKALRAVRGQYHSNKGVFFGGEAVQPESQIVQDLVKKYAKSFKNVLFVDYHTGLGKYGINQIMVSPDGDVSKPEIAKTYEKELKVLKTFFPKEECEGICDLQMEQSKFADMENTRQSGAHSYLNTGDITQWVHNHDPEKRASGIVLSFTAEIGTKAGRKVLEGIVDENFCFWNRETCGADRYTKEVERLRQLFNPSDEKWKTQVVRAGRQMCGAFKKFSEL